MLGQLLSPQKGLFHKSILVNISVCIVADRRLMIDFSLAPQIRFRPDNINEHHPDNDHRNSARLYYILEAAEVSHTFEFHII